MVNTRVDERRKVSRKASYNIFIGGVSPQPRPAAGRLAIN